MPRFLPPNQPVCRIVFLVLLALGGLAFCRIEEPEKPIAPVRFEEASKQAGVHFVLRNSSTPEKHLIETMLAGVAVFDYNGDGKPDIYFVNGADIPSLDKSDPSLYNRLFRNEGNGTFSDVTAQAGVKGAGYSMGAAIGDFNNDGLEDIFVVGVNRNILYRNRGNGTFEDVTERAGVSGGTWPDHKPWSVAAGWFDYDNDDYLDLFVVNYVEWNPKEERSCSGGNNLRIYCHPEYYNSLPDFLYHNNGDGTFTDVSQSSGIAAYKGKGMGLAFGDVDHDGKLDVLVANDTLPNFLFHNEGGGKFKEIGLSADVAYNEDGRAISSMGVDFRDYNNDGWEDVFISALQNEVFPLFRNTGKGTFEDISRRARLARFTRTMSGWSDGFFDLNNDGYKDLFIAAGDVQDNAEAVSNRKSRQPNSVLVNQGNGAFADASGEAGQIANNLGQHRGAAFGDFDGDGKIDVVVTRLNETAELFHNVSPQQNHWLDIHLVGRKSNRDAIGTLVKLTGASGRRQWNRVVTSVGYACSSDRTVHFGLGQEEFVKELLLEWPSGEVQRVANVSCDRLLTVQEP
jgi:enediyne biosynthesis protein E4